MMSYPRIRFQGFFLCGVLLSISELGKQLLLTFVVNNGCYYWWYFPFQLCSIPMYVMLILPWIRPKAQTALLTFLATFGLLGGIAAFADTSGLQYSLSILTAHSYCWHILLIASGICAGLALRRAVGGKPTLPLFGLATLLYLSCCAIAEILNLLLSPLGTINLFYINPEYRMQQVVFRDIAEKTGNLPSILLYILATVCGAFLLFYFWKLNKAGKKK